MVQNDKLLDYPKLLEAIEQYPDINLDVVGEWTIFKERVVSSYMEIFQNILSNVKSQFNTEQRLFTRIWIDTCCSSGVHVDRVSNDYKPGSALLAAAVHPPFDEYYFIDTCQKSLAFLQTLLGISDKYYFVNEDCNECVPRLVQEKLHWKRISRGLVFVDPYGLDINWDTMQSLGRAGKEDGGRGSVDCFINYPHHDIQRNVCVASKELLKPCHSDRMTSYWGDESWMQEIFPPQENLFGEFDESKIQFAGTRLKKAYQQRLKEVAGFKHVLDPLPMRNRNIDMFYLYFATNNDTAIRAARDCFNRIRKKC